MAKKFDVVASNYAQTNSVAAGTLSAGDIILGTSLNGFTLVDLVSGDGFAEIRKCENVKVAKAAVAFTVDDPLYWDDTAKVVTNVSTSNTLIGYCREAAASGDAYGYMFFDGFAAFLKA